VNNFDLNTIQLTGFKNYNINDKITVRKPLIRDIDEYGEENYLNAVNLFCLKPYDMMVQLDGIGIDYEEISNYDLFLMIYEQYKEYLKFFIIGDFDFDKLKLAKNNQNNETVLAEYNENTGRYGSIIFDRLIYERVSHYIKTLNFISEKNEFKPANVFAKQMIIDEKKREMERNKKRNIKIKSHIGCMIRDVSYNEITTGINIWNVWDLTIYQLYDAYFHIMKNYDYKNNMIGIYTGNIDTSKISIGKIKWSGDIEI
jgi:hypothetical protein